MMGRICKTCRWWEDGPAPMIAGLCRRRAPFPVQGAPNDKALFPPVYEDDWCGQWKWKAHDKGQEYTSEDL